MSLTRPIWEQIAAASVIAFGAALSSIASTYPQGTLLRPGPGFLPFYIGLLLALLGGLIMIENRRRGARAVDDPAPSDDAEEGAAPTSLRPVLAISVSIVVFALLLERLGFVPAMMAMFLCIGFAERGQNLLALLGVCVFMAVFGTVLFIWGLGMPIPVFGAS